MTKKQRTNDQEVLVKTEAKYLKISPRKLRLVVDLIRRLPLSQALEKLDFVNKKGAPMVKKALKTAIADAVHNFGLAKESLKIHQIFVNEGPRLKRYDKSHRWMRPGIIQKRQSHLVVVLKGTKSHGAKG